MTICIWESLFGTPCRVKDAQRTTF